MYLKKRLDALIERAYLANDQHVSFIGSETLFKRSYGDNLRYVPNPTGAKFHTDDSFVKLIMGPYGSGKSTVCAQEIIRRACAMPVWYKGRRRSKWAIVRNTTPELHSTTLQTWLAWAGDLGDIQARQKPLLTYEHTFNDGAGVVELELIFIALDREDQIKKIKSLEVTGCYINELSEVPQSALSHLKGRVNHRYPSRAFCADPYWSGIIADTNPPDEDHWICKDFADGNQGDYKLFVQPKGLIVDEHNRPIKDKYGKYVQNPECDNHENLAADYYTKLAENQREGFIRVYCLGMYGTVESGKRVLPEYNDDLHSVETLDAVQGLQLDLSFDYGLTPACLVTQLTPRGYFLVLKEYQGEDMGIRTFAESVLIPGLARDFPYCKIGGENVGDPAGRARSQIYEELSCMDELNKLGIKTRAAKTNNYEPRLNSVRSFLNRMLDGKPAIVISRQGCPILRKGLQKGYVYKRLAVAGEEKYKDEPDKNFYSHLQDTLQYRAMEYESGRILLEKSPKERVNMYNPVMRI